MLTIKAVNLQRYTHFHAHASSCTQNINTPTAFSGTLRASYDPSKKKSMKAVTQMEKSWQVEKRRGQDRSWSRHKGKIGRIWSQKRVNISALFRLRTSHFMTFTVVFLEHRILNHLIGYLQQAVRCISVRAIVYRWCMGIWLDAVAHCKPPWAFNWLFI